MPRHLTRLDAIDVNAVLFGVSKVVYWRA
jgi:hypothetical protein